MKTRCTKKSFDDLESARIRLTEIYVNSDRKKKPVNVYECEKCGKYHLSSIGKKDHKKMLQKWEANINNRVKKREERFINNESEYWEKYYGFNQ